MQTPADNSAQRIHWRSLFRHFRPFVVRHKWLNVFTLLGYGVGALLTSVAMPLIYKRIMDTLSVPGSQATEILYDLAVLLVVVIVAYNICYRIADWTIVRAQGNALKYAIDYALERLYEKSYTFYTNTFTGGLVAKIKRFVNAYEHLHDQFVFQVWMQGISLLSSIVVLWWQSWKLGLLFIGWLVLYALLVRVLIHYTLPKSLTYAEADSDVTAHLSDIVTNMLTVKAAGTSVREQEGFKRTTERQRVVRHRAWMQDGFWNSMYQGVTVSFFEIAIVIAALVLWHAQIASPGLVLLVIIYVIQSFDIVWNLSKNTIRIMTAFTDANEMVEILDSPVDVIDPEQPEDVRVSAGRIEFDGVTHAYDNASELFTGFDLTIEPGEKVALVGHSGAGKTTAVKMLLRFIDITKGSIRVDGQDIRHVRQDDLRAHMAYVPQEPMLFHRTILENIAYTRPDATRAEVEEVARRAHAHEFIARLPNGYDTLVGERGVKLSGGERQRVAIARALLKDVPIVILDEATSSLDSVSERHIQAAFDELMEGRTTIVIAHRLSTIQHMDRIVVLDQGRVAEQGTHADLCVLNGIYAELWRSQVGGFIQD